MLNNFSFPWDKFFYLFEFLVVVTLAMKNFCLSAHLWGWVSSHFRHSPLPVWQFYGSLHLTPTFLEFRTSNMLCSFHVDIANPVQTSLSPFWAVNLCQFLLSNLAPHISCRFLSISLHRKVVPSSVPCKFKFPCYA